MESGAHPEHIDIEERQEGIIAYIDRVGPNGRHAIIEDVAFDDDRIHDAPTGSSPSLPATPEVRPSRRAFVFSGDQHG
jgi:hypothetical protein